MLWLTCTCKMMLMGHTVAPQYTCILLHRDCDCHRNACLCGLTQMLFSLTAFRNLACYAQVNASRNGQRAWHSTYPVYAAQISRTKASCRMVETGGEMFSRSSAGARESEVTRPEKETKSIHVKKLRTDMHGLSCPSLTRFLTYVLQLS